MVFPSLCVIVPITLCGFLLIKPAFGCVFLIGDGFVSIVSSFFLSSGCEVSPVTTFGSFTLSPCFPSSISLAPWGFASSLGSWPAHSTHICGLSS